MVDAAPRALPSDGALLALLTELCRLVDGEGSLDAILDAVLRAMARHLGIVRGTVTLLQRDIKEIRIEAAYGLTDAEQARGRYQLGEGITGQVVVTGQPAVVPRIADAQLLNRTGAARAGEAAFLSVPIRFHDDVLGALGVDWVLDEADLEEAADILQVVAAIIAQAAALRQASRELELSYEQSKNPAALVGRSKAVKAVLDAVRTVAPSDATVLIRGESGVGKELVADAIHELSRRADKPFVKVNCAALPESLLESELFGHEAGAFTGAVAQRRGRFELAHGGTIFLDEIGDFSPSSQITLLRILQQKEFQRVGGHETLKADVRVVAATNRDLEALMAEGKFRQDLYYRLNVFPIHVPPLRERRTDILLLADAFVERLARKNGKTVSRLSTPAIDMLMAYHWPGNVRELENCIERAVLLTQDGVIHGHHLPPSLQTAEATGTAASGGLEATLAAVERDLLQDALKTARGNMAEAARAMGLTERKMGLRVKKHDIDPRKYKR
ncbi:MAG: sigma 54-interacting transcriptional regulator [Myxococcales bacterium]|nr:sigma 54-interacting transcriptional regulator [Myxococcales bacterium]MCB9649827.1 sigma 54-interacting transcriptional regulator [Deltaproteobacteria bacterium]